MDRNLERRELKAVGLSKTNTPFHSYLAVLFPFSLVSFFGLSCVLFCSRDYGLIAGKGGRSHPFLWCCVHNTLCSFNCLFPHFSFFIFRRVFFRIYAVLLMHVVLQRVFYAFLFKSSEYTLNQWNKPNVVVLL